MPRDFARLKELDVFNAPIVTTLEPIETFFTAEDEHHAISFRDAKRDT